MKSMIPVLAVLWLSACATSSGARPDVPTHSPAPWSESSISRGKVRNVTLQEWSKASNRSTCSALAFSSLGAGEGGAPRSANFSGGWAVAFDKPGSPGLLATGEYCESCGRGSFGIAGTGSEEGESFAPPEAEWVEWSDGSRAALFLQGGTGPWHVAYLTVEGERCLYNVWTHLGRNHLEYLLHSIRYVE